MRMRRSRVLAKLRGGGVASCIKLNMTDPRAAEIAALSGFDCIWLCTEHVSNTWREIEDQIRAAKMFDVDTVVRVSRGCYSDMIRPLEIDAAGIMVPHVISAEEAEQVVRQTRFHPLGRRALDGGNADAGYTQVPCSEYLSQANEQRFVILQIEDVEAMDELEKIAEVRGVDMLFSGALDFSHSLGIPGQMDNPRIKDAARRIAEVARKHGKFAGAIACPKKLREMIDMGYQFLSVGADIVSLTQDFGRLAKAFHQETVSPVK